VPALQLFSLDGIDLTGVVADRAGIATIIPHRGDMLLLDRVVWHDAGLDHGVAIKNVRHDEFWVPGHIPGQPLMPGVLMVEASAQMASWMYYKRSGESWFAGFTHIQDTSFREQVLPGDELILLCQCLKYTPKRFVCRAQGLVNGRIAFDTTVTGMAFPKMPTPQRRPLEEFETWSTARGGSVGPR
jgi:3-hydroxyacyl-[acyl-carrier-protein] dehydratase